MNTLKKLIFTFICISTILGVAYAALCSQQEIEEMNNAILSKQEILQQEQKFSPLINAVLKHDAEQVYKLLYPTTQAGNLLHSPAVNVNDTTENGATALMYACLYLDQDIIDLILQEKTLNKQATDNQNNTPIGYVYLAKLNAQKTFNDKNSKISDSERARKLSQAYHKRIALADEVIAKLERAGIKETSADARLGGKCD